MRGVFLDLETTGLDTRRHCVIELAFRVIDLTSGDEIASLESVVSQPRERWDKHDPNSIQINGFTWERVQNGRPEKEVAEDVKRIMAEAGVQRGEAVFICQNPSFDRNFLTHLVSAYEQEELNWPYHWLDLASMYWSYRARGFIEEGRPLPEKLPISKDTIAEYFGLPPEEKPHRAINGVDHLILCYRAVLGIGQRV